jgi:hypothetical protein
MTAAAFDTLKLARSLRDQGDFTQKQAEGLAAAFADVSSEHLITRADLREEFAPIKTEIAQTKTEIIQIKAEMIIVRWMNGFMLAALMAIFYLLLKR